MHNLSAQILVAIANSFNDDHLVETGALEPVWLAALVAMFVLGVVIFAVFAFHAFRALREYWSMTPDERQAERKRTMAERTPGLW